MGQMRGMSKLGACDIVYRLVLEGVDEFSGFSTHEDRGKPALQI